MSRGEATLLKAPYPREVDVLSMAVAVASGEVYEMLDGRAGISAGLNAGVVGDGRSFYVDGTYTLPKTAAIAILNGGEVYWDRVNSKATFNRFVTGAFFVGTAVADAAEADTEVTVDLNVRPWRALDLLEGLWDSVVVKTAGAPILSRHSTGAGITYSLDATAEAQKVDSLSQRVIRTVDGPIFEARINIADNGNNAALDINFGLANGTNAADADLITEHAFFHIDGNALLVNAQSKDPVTTVAAVNTTVPFVLNTPQEYWIDARDPTSVKFYQNGVRVLTGTTFRLDNAVGPLKALVHMEKTANATTGSVLVDGSFFRVRSTDL